VSSFVGREQGVVLIEEYERKTLYPILVNCHEHLHPLVRLDLRILLTKIFLNMIKVWIFLNKLQSQMN
jgi:hypothetical protein